MGYWGFEIMKGDDPCDRFNNIANIIGLNEDMRYDIVTSFNANSSFNENTKKFLIDNFVVEDVIDKLTEHYKEKKNYFGIHWMSECFRSLSFGYALGVKSIPDFKNNLLLCAFKINFLETLEESETFNNNQRERRVAAVIDFHNDICATKIGYPKGVNLWEDNGLLFEDFLRQVKYKIFSQEVFTKEDLYEIKSSLIEINKSGWNYLLKEEIFIDIEKRCLDASVKNAFSNKKNTCKI